MTKKTYQIIYQFSDVINNIKAESEEEASKIADERLISNDTPQADTYCYEMEIEERK